MNHVLNREQKQWVAKIAELAQRELNAGPDEFTPEVWRRCAEDGLIAMCIPEKTGGLSDSAVSSLIAHYALGYGCTNNGLTFAVNNHLIVAEGLFPRLADSGQIARYSAGLADGSVIASYAITEPDHGSDSFSLATRAEEAGDRFILNGSKTYISNAPIADLFVVIARTDEGVSSLNALSAFLVHKDDPGVTIGREISKMGLHGCPMAELVLNACEIPKDRLLGQRGGGVLAGNAAMEWERTFVFASHLGTMQRIMEECVKYANSRKQFNRSIGSNQLVADKIVQMGIAVEFGLLLMLRIGAMRDQGRNTYYESSMFKYHVGEKYAEACLDALQIFGAYGYSAESGIERQVRDALAAKIYSGTSEVQLDILSRLMGIHGAS